MLMLYIKGMYLSIKRWKIYCLPKRWQFQWCLDRSCVRADIEKKGKTSLFKGISQNPDARTKHVNAVPMLTKVSESEKGMVHVETHSSGHHEESKRQTSEDLAIVKKYKM